MTVGTRTEPSTGRYMGIELALEKTPHCILTLVEELNLIGLPG